ncbi:SUMF1/EgtB/PvdO family nonheme iron enzyme [Afifella marina]|uniref:Formylglycine-generating enzyme, required for sulfatase activity, contains SUMF1/FGE domain n=1 Tax=Afifella marina DSM 2698 TaxID=1120955 RepID=A0A1G5NYA0_AFIMA|nr:SUMF1/EgtB/PvdO family nonheme iron enzyme [Afifella marina]MBK1624947.1 nitrate reductase [Afifella marina DSM 2698]MBK1628650.1 nitrate reductase [Afifella marina]MBK5916480.1 nitrate reductase [Afifella marina]RAI17697.1 nitrate reductase [Afifella marina DSM 2698]SCZ42332.1 Formylglycine-generating enzyme, required for sulfatase activity, contains SUMF1/FGE domain [Afifella marina DSM 2698]
MQLHKTLRDAIASGALLLAFSGSALVAPASAADETTDDAAFVRIESQEVAYRPSGEFLRGNHPVDPPLAKIRPERAFFIMKRQVTRGEYSACVAAGACRALDEAGDAALPLVGVSYDDAMAYAAYLSEATGDHYRLPSDEEWAIAAGSRFHDDGLGVTTDTDNPAERWLASYDAEAARARKVEAEPRPIGSFGENENGLLDVSGNVWEWTSTCFTRHRLDETGASKSHESCGVRIAEGEHRAYLTSFVRDPSAGACSVGIPPANLGIRLVREDKGFFGRIGEVFGF